MASANPRIAYLSSSSILLISDPISTPTPPSERPTSRRETPRALCNASSLADPSNPSIVRNNSLSPGRAVSAARTAGDVAIFVAHNRNSRKNHTAAITIHTTTQRTFHVSFLGTILI
jgi:hypothetical protein